jgi:hypothetical protein
MRKRRRAFPSQRRTFLRLSAADPSAMRPQLCRLRFRDFFGGRAMAHEHLAQFLLPEIQAACSRARLAVVLVKHARVDIARGGEQRLEARSTVQQQGERWRVADPFYAPDDRRLDHVVGRPQAAATRAVHVWFPKDLIERSITTQLTENADIGPVIDCTWHFARIRASALNVQLKKECPPA